MTHWYVLHIADFVSGDKIFVPGDKETILSPVNWRQRDKFVPGDKRILGGDKRWGVLSFSLDTVKTVKTDNTGSTDKSQTTTHVMLHHGL